MAVLSLRVCQAPAWPGVANPMHRKQRPGDFGDPRPYLILGLLSWDDDDDFGYDPEDFFDEAGQDEFDDEDTFSDEFDDEDKDEDDGLAEEDDEFDEEECDY